MNINSKLLILLCCMVLVKPAQSEVIDKRITSCKTEDQSTQVYLKRSTPESTSRAIWIENNDGEKHMIWEGKRQQGMSIATNRTPQKLVGGEPDPYQSMELVKAAYNGQVLVVIARTKFDINKRSENISAYTGGMFFDQIFHNYAGCAGLNLLLPPHTDYSWIIEEVGDKPRYADYRAPWYNEHQGYEYFLRSFKKNENGKWEVHISAALSVLWADSLSLPMKSLSIDDENTYSVVFDGKYKYYKFDCYDDLKRLNVDKYMKSAGYLYLFDFYGDIERLIYRGDVAQGKTIERIKYIPINSKSETDTKQLFKCVHTTLHGGESFHRIAYERDYWRGINSWVKYDELKLDQVYRDAPSPKDGYIPQLANFGTGRPWCFSKLQPGEIRQSYTLNIKTAREELNKNRKELESLERRTKSDDLVRFRKKRFELYLKLVDEALENYK